MILDLQRYQGLAEFRYALRHFLAESESICETAGVTSAQYQLLQIIAYRGKPMTMKALAEQLLLKHHSAVQLTDRMSKKGLLERIPSPQDGRLVFVGLTASGESLFVQLAAKHLVALAKHAPSLSKALRRISTAARGQQTKLIRYRSARPRFHER